MATNNHPCPDCGHDNPHNDEVCYCEFVDADGVKCDCDRTSVFNFYGKKLPEKSDKEILVDIITKNVINLYASEIAQEILNAGFRRLPFR